jgi:hydroxypyruvate isomerase
MADRSQRASRRAVLGGLAAAAGALATSDNIRWIGHFHTGGVPGRHEIDAGQELNYHAIAAAIADLDYPGYVAHEFVPTRADPFDSLAEAFRVCTV